MTGLFFRAQAKLLAWTLKQASASPAAKEAYSQLLSPVQFPLLRFSLRNARSLPAFESAIRPLLVPHEDIRDVDTWYENNYFKSMVRLEYLRRRCGLQDQAKMQELVQQLGGDGVPSSSAAAAAPSFAKVVEVFGLGDWNRKLPSSRAGELDPDEIRKAELVKKVQMEGPDVSGWPMEDLLEVGGACVWGRGPLNVYLEHHGMWEMWCNEYIQGLSHYIHQRLESYRAQELAPQEPVALEVGAGDGHLAHYVNAHLPPGVKYVATDITKKLAKRGNVQKLDYIKALDKYQPTMVICSWMPHEDWSQAFRSCPSVQEYVLIGEADTGICGDNWLTWGNPHFRPAGWTASTTSPSPSRRAGGAASRRKDGGRELPMPPPYQSDGFERVDLGELSAWQWSRYDSEAFARNSRTVSFRRRSRKKGP